CLPAYHPQVPVSEKTAAVPPNQRTTNFRQRLLLGKQQLLLSSMIFPSAICHRENPGQVRLLWLTGPARRTVDLPVGIARVGSSKLHVDRREFGWLPWALQRPLAPEVLPLLHRPNATHPQQ